MGCVRDTRAYKCHMAAEIVFVRACGCNLSLSFTALLCEIRALKSLGQPYTQHGAHQSDQICTYRHVFDSQAHIYKNRKTIQDINNIQYMLTYTVWLFNRHHTRKAKQA